METLNPILAWLLGDPNSEPALRYQTLRDLTDPRPKPSLRERARIHHQGLGANILARRERIPVL